MYKFIPPFAMNRGALERIKCLICHPIAHWIYMSIGRFKGLRVSRHALYLAAINVFERLKREDEYESVDVVRGYLINFDAGLARLCDVGLLSRIP